MENKEIEYYIKHVYGNQHMYVKDKEIAQQIQILTNQKTLSTNHMMALNRLGFTFKQVLP